LFGGRLGHFALVIEAPYYHVEILPSAFPGYPVARCFAAIAITMQSATGRKALIQRKARFPCGSARGIIRRPALERHDANPNQHDSHRVQVNPT
jgi:hypothetical protein